MNRRAFTFIEVTVVSVLAINAILSFNQLLFIQLRSEAKTASIVGNQLEHRSVRNYAKSVSANSLTWLMCGAPHPFMRYDAVLGKCVAGNKFGGGTYSAPTATERTRWNDLANAVYAWATTATPVGGRYNRTLDATVFTTTIRPLVLSNNCHQCHDGSGAAPIMNRDLRTYAGWLNPPALISNVPFATAMGQTLIRETTKLPSLQVGNTDTIHEVRFFSTLPCASANIVVKTQTTPTQVDCPGPTSLCQYPDASSCTIECLSSSGGSSSTAASCSSFKLTVNCYVPNTFCASGPLPCPAPLTAGAGSCLENQPSVACGEGATTWRCVDPANPGIPTPPQYAVSTLFTDLTQKTRTRFWSGGALP